VRWSCPEQSGYVWCSRGSSSMSRCWMSSMQCCSRYCRCWYWRSVWERLGWWDWWRSCPERWVLVTVSTVDRGYGWGLVCSVRWRYLMGWMVSLLELSIWQLLQFYGIVMLFFWVTVLQYVELVDVNAGLVSVESWIRPEPWHVEL